MKRSVLVFFAAVGLLCSSAWPADFAGVLQQVRDACHLYRGERIIAEQREEGWRITGAAIQATAWTDADMKRVAGLKALEGLDRKSVV